MHSLMKATCMSFRGNVIINSCVTINYYFDQSTFNNESCVYVREEGKGGGEYVTSECVSHSMSRGCSRAMRRRK